jgi:hypothetical protein
MRKGFGMRFRFSTSIASAACIAGLVTIASFATAPCFAASIPAWLDDAITGWNERNPASTIEFVAIKDSFVWYRMQSTPEIGHKEIRDITYKLVQDHGYVTMDDEELLTTGKPPTTNAPSKPKKCWRRSFVLTIEKQSNTTAVGDSEGSGVRQRMLTSMVCQDPPYWDTGFRIAE